MGFKKLEIIADHDGFKIVHQPTGAVVHTSGSYDTTMQMLVYLNDHTDIDLNTGSEVELHKRINGWFSLGGRKLCQVL